MKGESSGWWCGKQDFLPEKSFEGWGSYATALKEAPARFVDRLAARSLDQTELQDVKAASHHDMKKTLTWWDLMWFGVGAVVGAGIFVLTGIEAKNDAGPAVVLSYAISGVSAMLSVFCYTEFAVEIPVAGGSFAYLRVELGDFVAFIAAGNILLEYIVASAAVARSFTSYLATLFNHSPDSFRIHAPALSEKYSHLDPVAVALIAVICVLAVLSVKGSSRLNYVTSVLHIAIILFIIIAGLTKADTNNYSTFLPYNAHGIFKAFAVLFFAYVGFDAVSTMAEETKNPRRDIPIGLVGSMVITTRTKRKKAEKSHANAWAPSLICLTCALLTTIIYCVLVVTLCLMQPYTSLEEDAPFSVAFEKVGMNWAKYIVAIGALMGMVTVLLVSAVGQARYLTHMARTHMMPPWFAHVSPRTGTPVNATVVMMVATVAVALFTNLEVLSNLLSISTLFIFTLVAVALLVRRYYAAGITLDADRNKLVVSLVLIVASSVATAVYWALNDRQWAGYCVTVPVWLLGTLLLSVWVPRAKMPMVWGVPMVPWLPSASIFINIFLLGSIDKDSFIRFGVWTALLLVYYAFLGMHASYDTAKGNVEMGGKNTIAKVEEGDAATLPRSTNYLAQVE